MTIMNHEVILFSCMKKQCSTFIAMFAFSIYAMQILHFCFKIVVLRKTEYYLLLRVGLVTTFTDGRSELVRS